MADPLAAPRPRPLHELRRLTVLFCDIVGSTELGDELDIEDYCALLDGFKELCRDRIRAAGGWPAQFQGDGVLAHFGYPALFEDPARRAVNAGLSIIRDLECRRFPLPSRAEHQLKVRISVHTGQVLISGASEADGSLPEGVSINIAKKIQSFAEDNSVVVTADTEELVRKDFYLEGPRPAKIDRVRPEMAIFRVTGERPEANGKTRKFSGNLPPMVARRAELQLIDERWRMAQQGLGQCIALLGEAGIGKSRLVHEFKRRSHIPAERWYELRCTPDTVDSAYFPFREFMTSRLPRLEAGDARQMQQQVNDRLAPLGLLSEPNEQALLSLLGAAPDGERGQPIQPSVIRQRIQEFLITFLLGLSQEGPFVLFLEDMHWADASTRDVVQKLALRCRNTPVLVICAQRPEIEHPFKGRSDITSLVLNPLPPSKVKELVSGLCPECRVTEMVAEQLFHLTGGNPLFVEQYVASKGRLLELEAAMASPCGLGPAAPHPAMVPPGLQELIAYRLEQLGEAKRAAQCAAVLGQYIQPDILRRVLDVGEADFDHTVDRLVQSEILAYTGEARLPELRFRHALIRDAAHATLLESQKQVLHRRIAELLAEEQAHDDLVTHEVIARHFALAREPRRSIDHWKAAASQAAARFANAEALSLLREALDQVNALPIELAEPAEFGIREAMAVPLEATLGWAAEETETNLRRLLDLQAHSSDDAELFGVYHGVCSMHGIRGEVSEALSYAAKMQAIAHRSGDLALRVLSLRVSGILYFLKADFPTALRLFGEMADLYSQEVRDRVSVHYPAHPVSVGHAFSAFARALTGEAAAALEELDRARTAIRSEKDDFTRAYVDGFASSVFLVLGDQDAATACAESCLALARRNSFDYWVSWASITLGYGRLACGAPSHEALHLMEQGLNGYRSTGSRQILPYALGLFADALLRTGQRPAALKVIEELERESRINEVTFFDGFNRKLIATAARG